MAEQIDPAVLGTLLTLVEPDERGDPGSPLRWTTKSLRHFGLGADPARPPGVGPDSRAAVETRRVQPPGQRETLEGAQHPDRDAQFRYINEQAKDHEAGDEPMISVNTKKREQLGRLPMSGREWQPKGEPVEAEDHSFFFSGPDVEQAIPYGIYDLIRNSGW